MVTKRALLVRTTNHSEGWDGVIADPRCPRGFTSEPETLLLLVDHEHTDGNNPAMTIKSIMVYFRIFVIPTQVIPVVKTKSR
jgi:hypothetical protein